ncbi:hypothetical protein CDAR_425941 [Caerostris darwini]|uniref:Uncharacterized protein n=1 Tax=Caerostris darwini TaxID=1538125 RepID=A0AAV4T6Q4_9ARAC|nr:hypothetical protein CDAR_425941 [Caerostris darwini]
MTYGQFYCFSPDEIDNFNLDAISPDSDVVCVLEVDLEIPPSQHERQNDWPMAPEQSLMSNRPGGDCVTFPLVTSSSIRLCDDFVSLQSRYKLE